MCGKMLYFQTFIYLYFYLFTYVNYNNVAYKIHDIMFLNTFKLFWQSRN